MKLHLGSGSIYLDGWLNVDLPGAKTFLASDRPDLAKRWRTTEDRYYARHDDKTVETLREGPLDQEYVCDRYGSFQFLPVHPGDVSEFLSRQAFEHLSGTEARESLRLLYAVIQPGGILRLDVPDHTKTLSLLMATRDPFYVRHLLGPKRGEYGVHMQSYSLEGLIALAHEQGFQFMEEEENIHLYPAICARFKRR